MKTYSAKPEDIKRGWHVIDATGKTLGKLATQAAILLLGKHKPIFTPNQDTGDHVVVLNAGKVHVTGNKRTQKTYYRYSGYPGGLRSLSLEEMLAKHPERVIEHAVKGMLPRNRLGAGMLHKLHVYAGDTHPHLAQTGSAKEAEQVKE